MEEVVDGRLLEYDPTCFALEFLWRDRAAIGVSLQKLHMLTNKVNFQNEISIHQTT
jgi:hypothetical protein